MAVGQEYIIKTMKSVEEAVGIIKSLLSYCSNIIMGDIVANLQNGVDADGAPLHRPMRLDEPEAVTEPLNPFGNARYAFPDLEMLAMEFVAGGGKVFSETNTGGPGIDTGSMLHLLKSKKYSVVTNDEVLIDPTLAVGVAFNAPALGIDAATYVGDYHKVWGNENFIAVSKNAASQILSLLRTSLV